MIGGLTSSVSSGLVEENKKIVVRRWKCGAETLMDQRTALALGDTNDASGLATAASLINIAQRGKA